LVGTKASVGIATLGIVTVRIATAPQSVVNLMLEQQKTRHSRICIHSATYALGCHASEDNKQYKDNHNYNHTHRHTHTPTLARTHAHMQTHTHTHTHKHMHARTH